MGVFLHFSYTARLQCVLHWCCTVLLTAVLQDTLTSGYETLSILLSICFSKNLLSSLTVSYECQNHMRFWEKNSMAIWIGSTDSGSFKGMGSFIALRVHLLIQIFCCVLQQYVVFFFMVLVRINFMCHFSSGPDEVTF